MRHDVDGVERRHRAAGEIERGRRDVDQMHREAAARRLGGGDERRQFVSAARAELDEHRQRIDARQNLAPVAREQGALGARNRIPRQLADRLEQRRTERVVEVARRQLPRRQREVILDVAGKRLQLDTLGGAIGRNGRSHRHMGTARGTSSGTWDATAHAPWRATPLS
jgi:hypothetical protein